ncbi:defensin-like protein 19 isoform X2 [Fagus crenata]
MVKQRVHQLAYGLLFLFFFLLVSIEMAMVEGKVCERRSKTWSGFCGNSGNCNRQCRNWEGAQHGACHAQFPGFACFCYFRC